MRLLPARQPDLPANAAIAVRVTIVASLLIARSGRFPVRRGASLLGRIMDDQGEGTPERLPSDIQFHRCIRWGRHGFSSPSPASARRSLQALLSREHVPALRSRVRMHSGTVSGPHDGVRENRSVALCWGKLQRPDDGDGFTASRHGVSRSEFREPYSPVFLHGDSGCTPGRLRRLPVWEYVQMPVDGGLTEMQSGDRSDVEAAELRSLRTRRHINAGHLGQVLVSAGVGCLSPQRADGCISRATSSSRWPAVTLPNTQGWPAATRGWSSVKISSTRRFD